MKPIAPNPFFNRHRITDPVYFYGRAGHVEQIYSAIVTRQSRSIVGERKLGKSSLLTFVMQPTVMQNYDLTTFDVESVLKTIIERGEAHFTSGPGPRRRSVGSCWARPNT